MLPPIFQLASADAGVREALGADPLRLYPFGFAPQGVALPYAVWQLVMGTPENYLAEAPEIDALTVQIDVYGVDLNSTRAAASSLRDALEPHGYIVAWRAGPADPDTRWHRIGFDYEHWTHR